MNTPVTPPGVPIPYPNLLSAAKTRTPVINSLGQLLGALRAGMPYGPLASLPAHYKAALHANGIRTPTGHAAQVQQEMIAQLEQNLDSLGEADQLRLQQAMDRLSKMIEVLSNVQKTQHDTAKNIINNLR